MSKPTELAEQARIVVAGSVNMDLVFRTPRMPQPGETLMGRSFMQSPGGKGANQAVAAARMGAQVAMVGRLGADALGAALRQALANDGIDTSQLRDTPEVATGTACILVDDDAGNCIVLTGGANQAVGTEDIDAAAALIRASSLLICQLEIPLHSVLRALAIARSAGRPVILNPAPVQPLPDAVLAGVDYLVVNETEASELSGIAVEGPDLIASAGSAAAALRARGASAVLVTLGAHGVYLSAHGLAEALPAVGVKAVDTTAAGDTFVGAFAVGLLEGLDLRAAATRAQYAAAITVTRPGAQSAIPARAEVDAFMAATA